jgi:hypothetical protein
MVIRKNLKNIFKLFIYHLTKFRIGLNLTNLCEKFWIKHDVFCEH